ncbi:hypothetical protein T12_14301 [Trichinella patagoniensis]|uniref:Uncharacterized protein n=1 Tax=Trichinella patagoniensis TaxID=990121 RepID=A0A0V0YSV0_9BILA|nr:hypothetical protein T12_14301 [Trichinella patagoniensis]
MHAMQFYRLSTCTLERRSESAWQQTSPNRYHSKDIPSPLLPVLVSHLRRNSVSLTLAAHN